MNPVLLCLLNLFCVIAVPYAIWYLGKLRTVVPCAVVQMALGVAMGPSVLGSVVPSIYTMLLPPAIRQQIDSLSTFAILFFALVTGLHLDLRSFSGRKKPFIFLSISSIFFPFIAGALAAMWFLCSFPSEVGNNQNGVAFVLSVAISLSVTALPILGAILRELGLTAHPIGQWSLGLAAVNDCALWFLVSSLLAYSVPSNEHLETIFAMAIFGIIYLGIMFVIVRPSLVRFIELPLSKAPVDVQLTIVTAFMLVSAAATEFAGLHHLLGAFIAGMVIPARTRQLILDRLENVMVSLLAPFFFVASGLRVSLDIESTGFLTIFVVATVTAIVGKFSGTVLPARLIGLSWREAYALGSLMQSKGMMELAILTILLDAKLISPPIFSALTLMAISTTALAMPMTRIFLYGSPKTTEPAVADLAIPNSPPSVLYCHATRSFEMVPAGGSRHALESAANNDVIPPATNFVRT